MNRAQLLFKAIDVIGYPLQNTVRKQGVICEKDIAYGDAERQKVDIYYADIYKSIKKTVVVNFHGGGFVMGNKKYRRSFAEILADKGYFVVNANYRLGPEHHFPCCAEDAVKVVDFLPVLARDHYIDLDKVVVCGDSAGAYVASFAVAAAYSEDLRKRLDLPELSVKPKGFIGFCGVYDVAKMVAMREPFGIAKVTGESFMGIKLRHNIKALMNYEYLDCVSTVDLVNSNWPESLIIYSAHDIICPHQGEAMIKKFSDCGVPCAFYKAPSLVDNHCFHFHFWRKASKEAMAAADRYLEEISRR